MKKEQILLGASVLLAVTSCSQQVTQVINRDLVLANPIDLDYRFETPPDTAAMKAMSSMILNGGWAEAMKKAAEVQLDYTKTDPTWDEVKAARGQLAFKLMDPANRKAAAGVTGSRTAADPVALRYKDKYFLFHSGADGYWISDDMQNWTHLDANFPAGVAPTVMVYNDEMYYVTSRINQIYKTTTPLDGMSWVPTDTVMVPYKNDPSGTAHDPYLYTENGKVYFYWESDYVEPIKVVEYDPENHFLPKTDPVAVIQPNWQKFGYEVPGDRNEEYLLGGYQEGTIMTKHDGKYYLQYATSGTEFDSYADGVYVGENPMGPFKASYTSPMSMRLGGFTTSAGHGDTFQDEFGNYWHLSTNIIGQREMFERRISLYPVVFTPKGNMYTLTWFGDYPFELPKKKVDFLAEDIHTGWMNLSLGKKIQVSSEQKNFEGDNASDNSIKTWWAAATGNEGEYIQMDLGHECTVQAIQPNFADHNCGYTPDMKDVSYKYLIEGSLDGKEWFVLFDKTANDNTKPHELLVLQEPEKVRYVKMTNKGQLPGQFSCFDLRIFGDGGGDAPRMTTLVKTERQDANRRRIQLSWKATEGADGYLLRWGTDKDELYTSMEIYGDTSVDLGCFDRDATYYFTLDSFNENGITRGMEITEVK